MIESKAASIEGKISSPGASMQFNQLPKISLKFKKICYQTPVLHINDSKVKFIDLIPDKISKQVTRINRVQMKENSSDINLTDGNTMKISTLLSMKYIIKTERKSEESDCQKSKSTPHTFRKMRIESSIQTEIINFFTSASVPKLLRTDYALWMIEEVSLRFILVFSLIV